MYVLKLQSILGNEMYFESVFLKNLLKPQLDF